MACVALRKESVDRNRCQVTGGNTLSVALRKESVDRNCMEIAYTAGYSVALRKESVDRNAGILDGLKAAAKSLSARRAWIEIARADDR